MNIQPWKSVILLIRLMTWCRRLWRFCSRFYRFYCWLCRDCWWIWWFNCMICWRLVWWICSLIWRFHWLQSTLITVVFTGHWRRTITFQTFRSTMATVVHTAKVTLTAWKWKLKTSNIDSSSFAHLQDEHSDLDWGLKISKEFPNSRALDWGTFDVVWIIGNWLLVNWVRTGNHIILRP